MLSARCLPASSAMEQETKNDMNVMIYMKSVCCHVALPETLVTLSARRLPARSTMEQETKNDMNVMICMKSVFCHVALPETFVTLSCQTSTGTQRHGAGDQE